MDLDKQYSDSNGNRVRFIRIVDYTQNTDDIRYIDKELSNNIINEKDVVIVRYGATAGFVGHGITGVLANNMFRVNPENDIAKDYLYIYLKQDKIYKKLNNSNGSSAMPALNFGTVKDVEIAYPLVAEQIEISKLFTNLDNLITLHHRKYTCIFYSWEQRKLEDFGKATGGTSIESEFSENGIYKVISIGSYSENSKYNDQGIRAILSDKTKEKILNKSDLTMILNDKTANGRIIGRVLYIDKSGTYVYNQRTERIEIYKEYFEPIFIYQLLNAPQIRNKIIKQSQGNTQIFVNWNGIKNTDYLVPNKQEQIKISKLLTDLDNLITLHQHKELKRRNDNNEHL